jgi:DnaJ-class molecular chaperone
MSYSFARALLHRRQSDPGASATRSITSLPLRARVLCEACAGKGTLPCGRCPGVILPRAQDCPSCAGTGRVPCGACWGMGLLDCTDGGC